MYLIFHNYHNVDQIQIRILILVSRYRDCQLPLRRFDQLLIWRQFDEGLVLPTSTNRTGQKTRPDRAVEAGWMDARPRSRAISALVQHAKAVFEERTDETALVAPISPSPAELIQTVLDNLRLGTHDAVLDLGCGDARWLVAAALRGCAGRGVDLNEDLLGRGHQAAAEAGVSSLVQLENKDIFDASLAGSSIIIVYLFREGVAKMKEKLEAEAKPGTRVVSVGFQIRGWTVDSTVAVGRLHAYLYRVPDRSA